MSSAASSSASMMRVSTLRSSVGSTRCRRYSQSRGRLMTGLPSALPGGRTFGSRVAHAVKILIARHTTASLAGGEFSADDAELVFMVLLRSLDLGLGLGAIRSGRSLVRLFKLCEFCLVSRHLR